jgi:hypothetical protein
LIPSPLLSAGLKKNRPTRPTSTPMRREGGYSAVVMRLAMVDVGTKPRRPRQALSCLALRHGVGATSNWRTDRCSPFLFLACGLLLVAVLLRRGNPARRPHLCPGWADGINQAIPPHPAPSRVVPPPKEKNKKIFRSRTIKSAPHPPISLHGGLPLG